MFTEILQARFLNILFRTTKSNAAVFFFFFTDFGLDNLKMLYLFYDFLLYCHKNIMIYFSEKVLLYAFFAC